MAADHSFQLDDLPSMMKKLSSDKGSCFSALSPNHSFAMDNVMRGHSTRRDKSKQGMGRSARIAGQASIVEKQLKKYAPKVENKLTKAEALAGAAAKASALLTHVSDNTSETDTTHAISPHWTGHFKKLDVQRTGMVSYDDFSDVLITAAVPSYKNYSADATASGNEVAALAPMPVSHKDAYQLALKLDPDKTGLINYHNLAPALQSVVDETHKVVAEQAVRRLSDLCLAELTDPKLKSEAQDGQKFHHKVSLFKDSEINAGVGAEYGKHNITAVRSGRFSEQYREDRGNLDVSKGIVTISDGSASSEHAGGGDGTDLKSLTSPIYNRFKRQQSSEPELREGEPISALTSRPINQIAVCTDKHSFGSRDNWGSAYTASLLAHSYTDKSKYSVPHYNSNRHTAFVGQFESGRRSKARGGRPLAEEMVLSGPRTNSESVSRRRSSSAPPARSKMNRTLGSIFREGGSDKENDTLNVNISASTSSNEVQASAYEVEHRNSLRSATSPKPTTSLKVPANKKTMNHDDTVSNGKLEKYNIPNSVISQLGGGKRLGSLRHALKSVDGSQSGSVTYSEFREALVNRLGLKLNDSEVRQLYSKNCHSTNGSVADKLTSNSGAYSNTNPLGDSREKSINIDEFVCNLQTRATSHMFGLHKDAVIVMRDATNPHNVISSTREEERVIKKVLHSTNKILAQDPVKVFSDMSKRTNSEKLDNSHSSSLTSHRIYSDSLLSDVSLSDFKEGLKYMGADLSDAEFYTLSRVLLTNNHSTNHNNSEHEIDHNFTVDRDNNAGAQVSEVDINKGSTRLNVKNAFDAMNRTVLLVDRVRSKDREDKLHNEGKYSASFKSHPSIIDHYHHHHFDALLENKQVNNDSTHRATWVDADAAEKASEYTSVGQYKSCVDSSFKWTKLKYSIQDKKDALLQAFTNQDITVQDLESPPAGLSAENRYRAPVQRKCEDLDARLKTIPFAKLPKVLKEHGVVLGDDDMHHLQERIRVHQHHGSHAHDSHYQETGEDAEVSLKQICHVVGLPLKLDPKNPRRGVVDHPLETVHQRDGNIFNSSRQTMLASDTYATTYLAGEHITGENCMPWNKGNRRKHCKPMSASYDPTKPASFWDLSHSGACTAILPTPQRSLAEFFLKGKGCDPRAYDSIMGSQQTDRAVDTSVPFTQPEFVRQYNNANNSVFGGSVYSNNEVGGADFASSANIGQVATGAVAVGRNPRSTSAPPRIRRSKTTESSSMSSCLDDSPHEPDAPVTCSGSRIVSSRHASSYKWADCTLSQYMLEQQTCETRYNRPRSSSVTPTSIGRYRDLGTDTTKANELAVARQSLPRTPRSLGELTGMSTRSNPISHYSLRKPSHGNTKEIDNVMKGQTVAHLLTHSNLHD